jgi:hypothetical protein
LEGLRHASGIRLLELLLLELLLLEGLLLERWLLELLLLRGQHTRCSVG